MWALTDIVEELEGKSNSQRRRIVKRRLETLGINYDEQRFLIGTHSNILVDLPEKAEGKRLLIASHYDKVLGSPGANDNASAVAVCLGLVERFKETKPATPLRIAFFDWEEKSLFGSRDYCRTRGVSDINAVLNYELVGEGSIPVFWPNQVQSKDYLNKLERAAKSLYGEAHFEDYAGPHTGDHQAFIEQGVRDSICLTMVCEEDRDLLEMIKRTDLTRIGIRELVTLHRSVVERSKTLRHYHKASDKAKYVREEVLQSVKEMTLRFVEYLAGEHQKP
ncbi:TPA: Zn-dependent exopeptidase M28 [Candidatus Woesearchaeota archaeon]|nr:Zn-dependent exopeptidase M28 [Candidatus Woesearchaeota archaeon]